MEQNYQVYNDIKNRTKGEIYIGVVGPVRTGKSTFIKRFMEIMVLPEIEDEHQKNQARDEIPQSSPGKTIMTTEPKFIPKNAIEIELDQTAKAKVRLIDCVGFMVNGATGHIENDMERMVKTPWYDYEIPFTKAAEIGTRKVIKDHSTIGIVVTTDGSFGDLNKGDYTAAEERTIGELQSIGKPFVVLLNSLRPYSDETKKIALEMQKKYDVSVYPVNCEQLKKDDIIKILQMVLLEFPVKELDFRIPKWLEILPAEYWLKEKIISAVKQVIGQVTKMKDAGNFCTTFSSEYIRSVSLKNTDLSNGIIEIETNIDDGYYYEVLSDFSGIEINSEYQLMNKLKELVSIMKDYDKVKGAISQVKLKGYGVVIPDKEEVSLEEPELIHHGNKYGVKIKAQAPSIQLIRAQIETEIAPIVGSEQQAKDLISYMAENAKQSGGIWEANIFGKSIEKIVEDGIETKISQITDDCQIKLQDTMQKIINDSNGGMICIII